MNGALRKQVRAPKPVSLAALVAMLALGWAGWAVECRGDGAAGDSPTSLSLDVAALETLYTLDLKAEQLQALQQMAAETADKRDRLAGKGPAGLGTALAALREALFERDGEKIDDLHEQADELRDDDSTKLDDDLDLTAAARRRAPDALRLLTASQVAAYVSENADDIADPLDAMLQALEETRDADQDDFEAQRNQLAADVALALAGLDVEKEKIVGDQVKAWLNQSRALNALLFKEKEAELKEAARTLVGQVDPLQVIRHYLQRDLAKLLSNPRLSDAIARQRLNCQE
jgi:hypothetical protein